MEVAGIVKDGRIVLTGTVTLPEGALVRVILETESPGEPFEREPISAEAVESDLAWATGKRFAP
ncbi:MAG: hypothetical protein IPG45_18195 [Deltaproteobacteria bacterium]|nr:hypothetical protein [Deltaproteobacteria bacterium]